MENPNEEEIDPAWLPNPRQDDGVLQDTSGRPGTEFLFNHWLQYATQRQFIAMLRFHTRSHLRARLDVFLNRPKVIYKERCVFYKRLNQIRNKMFHFRWSGMSLYVTQQSIGQFFIYLGKISRFN